MIANHHRGRLEDGVRDLGNAELLVVGLLRRDDRRVRREHEVNAYEYVRSTSILTFIQTISHLERPFSVVSTPMFAIHVGKVFLYHEYRSYTPVD